MNDKNPSKAKSLTITVLALAVIGSGAFAWKQNQELILLRASPLTADQVEALKRGKEDAEKQGRELAAQLAAAQGAVRNGPAGGRASQTQAQAPASNARGQLTPAEQAAQAAQQRAQMQAIMTSPDYQKAEVAVAKSNIELQYAPFFKNAGIPADQATQIKGILADRVAAIQDINTAAREAGMTGDALSELVRSAEAQSDQAVAAALGENFAAYQTYQQTLARRTEAASYQIALTMSGVPMNDAQTEALIAALAERPAAGRGGAAARTGVGAVTVTTVQNISANNMAAITSVLSPAQVQVLQTMQQQQQATAQLTQLASSARGSVARQGTVTGGGDVRGTVGGGGGTLGAEGGRF